MRRKGAFYWTENGTFVIVLKEVELIDLYSHEINFKGKVGIQAIFSESSHCLLVEKMNGGEEISQMLLS